MEGIERIESLINRNRATIFVYYAKAARLEYAFLKLQERVVAASAMIGTEFRVAATKSDPQQLSNRFLVFQARGEGTLDQIRSVVDEKITPQLESIDGISSVEVYGGRSRSIEVVLDHQALESYGITAGQVAARIAEQSGKREYLGQAIDRQKRYFVNLVSQYASLPSFGDLVIKDAGPVVLKAIATIGEGGSEQTTISRVNGQESVAVTLQRTWDSNLISLAHRTRRILKELDAAVKPSGVSLVVQADEAKTIEDNLNSILGLAVIGGLLAVAVLWVFLRNLRLVLIVAVSVPVSILISLNLFYALGITINTLTLVGLAIAIGMLVDNSVVVLENIFRHMGLKQDAWTAVVRGTKEVSRAIVSSTLTTVAVFVPFLFSTNATVKTLGRQVGAAIISTLLVSLAVAFLVIPTLSYRILRAHPDMAASGIFARWRRIRPMQIFTVLLKTSLRAPGPGGRGRAGRVLRHDQPLPDAQRQRPPRGAALEFQPLCPHALGHDARGRRRAGQGHGRPAQGHSRSQRAAGHDPGGQHDPVLHPCRGFREESRALDQRHQGGHPRTAEPGVPPRHVLRGRAGPERAVPGRVRRDGRGISWRRRGKRSPHGYFDADARDRGGPGEGRRPRPGHRAPPVGGRGREVQPGQPGDRPEQPDERLQPTTLDRPPPRPGRPEPFRRQPGDRAERAQRLPTRDDGGRQVHGRDRGDRHRHQDRRGRGPENDR